jgi:hypothetical protein
VFPAYFTGFVLYGAKHSGSPGKHKTCRAAHCLVHESTSRLTSQMQDNSGKPEVFSTHSPASFMTMASQQISPKSQEEPKKLLFVLVVRIPGNSSGHDAKHSGSPMAQLGVAHNQVHEPPSGGSRSGFTSQTQKDSGPHEVFSTPTLTEVTVRAKEAVICACALNSRIFLGAH